jgi:hypothetical protein
MHKIPRVAIRRDRRPDLLSHTGWKSLSLDMTLRTITRAGNFVDITIRTSVIRAKPTVIVSPHFQFSF